MVDTTIPCADVCDHMRSHDGGPLSIVATWAHSVLFELHEAHAEVSPIGLDSWRLALLDALKELSKEMSSELTPQAWIQFISAMKDQLQALCHQPTNDPAFLDHDRVSPISSVERYIGTRRLSAGFVLGFELILYLLGLDNNPIHLHELRDLAIDYMCMCNDMVSVHMETLAGDYFNLPSVVYESGVAPSFQDALGIVAEMIRQVDARCLQVVDTICENEELMGREPKLEVYLSTVMSCMSGALHWSFETKRYGLKLEDADVSG